MLIPNYVSPTFPTFSSADDNVKRIFSLKFHPRKETNYFYQDQLMSLVRRHKLDDNSIEVRSEYKPFLLRHLSQAQYLRKTFFIKKYSRENDGTHPLPPRRAC